MSSDAPLVLVSGVSGYIGSWVAYAALKLGYRVRGTVRSLANESKVAHLRDLCPGSAHKLELVEADLNSEKGWAEAVKGTTFICHVASPFPLGVPKDKYELITPAVEGTLHVLRAAAAALPRPRRVVVTSSFAAVGYGQQPNKDKPYNENDNWTVVDDPYNPIGAYIESKTRAERAAWDFVQNLPEDERFELATVNPTLVQGPMLSSNGCSSAQVCHDLMMGKIPVLADMDMFVTDVYDVVRLHMLAMSHPDAANKRFLSSAGVVPFSQFAQYLKEEFSQYGYNISTLVAPKPLLWLASWFDKQVANILPDVGKRYYIEPQNASKVLNYTLNTDFKGIVVSMARAAIANGLIPDKSENKTLSSSYTRPDLDLSMIPDAATVAAKL